MGISVTPRKTKTPLVVNPDTVLPLPLAAQGFQAVPRWCRQIAQFRSAVQLAKLSAGDAFHGSKATTGLPVVKSLGFRAAERPDHLSILYRIAFNVKQKARGHGTTASVHEWGSAEMKIRPSVA